MQSRIQGACHARIAVLTLAAIFSFSPSVLRAGGDDPPHGRPGMGGDVAMRGCTMGAGRTLRSAVRPMAPPEARDPLEEIEAAVERWLPVIR